MTRSRNTKHAKVPSIVCQHNLISTDITEQVSSPAPTQILHLGSPPLLKRIAENRNRKCEAKIPAVLKGRSILHLPPHELTDMIDSLLNDDNGGAAMTAAESVHSIASKSDEITSELLHLEFPIIHFTGFSKGQGNANQHKEKKTFR